MMRATTFRWSMFLALVALLESGTSHPVLFAEEAKPADAPLERIEPDAPVARVADIPVVEGENVHCAFTPRPGRFELKVPQGWTGILPLGPSEPVPWTLTGSSQIGVKRGAKSDASEIAALFPCDDSVLEISGEDDGFAIVRARRTGTATLQYGGVSPTDGKPARCELRIVVHSDTTEFDQAIREAAPRSNVRVVDVAQGCLLLGTVSSADEAALIRQVAQLFYPSVIERLEVVSVEEPRSLKSAPPAQPTVPPRTSQLPEAQPNPPVASQRQPISGAQRLPTKLPSPRVSSPEPHPTRDLSELKALRDDVRGLREDVRRLSELLKQRQTNRDLSQSSGRKAEGDVSTSEPVRSEVPIQTDGLVCFTASWCGPCQQMAPMLKRLSDEGRLVQIIDVDKSPNLVRRLRVDSIPCFIQFREGQEVQRVRGITEESVLRRMAGSLNHIQAGLNKPISLAFEEAQLDEAVTKIGSLSGFNVVLDTRGLEEEGLRKSQPVTITVEGITTRAALRLILEPLHLEAIERDEVLLVTSRQRARGELTVVSYDVEDLLPMAAAGDDKAKVRTIAGQLDEIAALIRSTISPETWDVVGGAGSLKCHEASRSLVVRQTKDVQHEIEGLLNVVRKLKHLPERTNANALQPLVYVVADLIVPLPVEPEDRKTPRATDWLKLIDSITTSVEPRRWMSNGGDCHIEPHESTMSLVIRATSPMHAAIADHLNEMRRQQDVQLVLETRLIQVKDDSVLKATDLKIELDSRTHSAQLQEPAAKRLLEALVASGASTLTAPKITLFNGQMGHIQTSIQSREGESKELKLYLRGAVSSDQKGVRLNVALNPGSLVRELVRQSHTLDDGGHLLIDMTDTLQREASAPFSGRFLVLVRSKVLVRNEELQTGSDSVKPARHETNGE